MNKFKKLITSIAALSFLTTTAHSHYDVLGGELILEAGFHSQYVSKGKLMKTLIVPHILCQQHLKNL